MKIYFKKYGVVKAMLEIRDKKLVIDDHIIGDEARLLEIFDKANKYDELVATFEEGGQ